MKYVSAEEALQIVQSGQRVFVHGSACTPLFMLHRLAEQAPRLRDVELVSISLYGDIVLDRPEFAASFRPNSLFVSDSIRQAVREGRGDYVPVFLSEIPEMFKRRVLPLDVAIVSVSEPDRHGFCSLGTSVDIRPLGFELLPERFSIPQLQKLYEAIYDMKLDRRNFSRKILSTGLLLDTGEKDGNSTTKRANLFRLDKERYKNKFYSFWNFMPDPALPQGL